MDLGDCYGKGFIRKIKPDRNLIKSLLEMSRSEEKFVKGVIMTEENVSTLCTLAYSSLREILEALCLDKGYKITNHICLGLLLKKELEDFDYALFERVRKIRNKISYYGNKIGLEEGTEIIRKIFELNTKLRKDLG